MPQIYREIKHTETYAGGITDNIFRIADKKGDTPA